MSYVKSSGFGITYNSFDSDAISKVTFYQITIEFKTYYFAIVCFKKNYTCSEYIYQVGSDTQIKYSMNYLSSAGKAFWSHIQPYNSILNCAPNFKLRHYVGLD